jgi:ureidoacrylate peracid hydrolase
MAHTDLPAWVWKRAQNLCRFDRIDLSHAALLVVDLQNAYVAEGMPLAISIAQEIIPQVNRLGSAMRAAGCPVIFLRHTTSFEGPEALPLWQQEMASPRMKEIRALLRPGKAPHDIYQALHREPGDVLIDKYRISAFARHSSQLDEVLQAAAIDTLVMCGAATNVCCETTARDAKMLGYKVFFISDATVALTLEEHQAALLNLALIFADVRTAEDMLALIESNRLSAKPETFKA